MTLKINDSIIRIGAATVAKKLALITVALVVANILAQVLRYQLDHPYVLGFVREFDLNQENNMPSYYSALLLVTASGLSGMIAQYSSQTVNRKHWLLLAIIFVYLSFDEATQIHETIGANIARLMGIQGIETYFIWTGPFSILALLLAVSYLRFLWRLAAYYRVMFIAAATVYVGGALGMELVGAWYAIGHGVHNSGYALCFTIEETMEMAGVVVFIYALLQYAREHIGGLLITLDRD